MNFTNWKPIYSLIRACRKHRYLTLMVWWIVDALTDCICVQLHANDRPTEKFNFLIYQLKSFGANGPRPSTITHIPRAEPFSHSHTHTLCSFSLAWRKFDLIWFSSFGINRWPLFCVLWFNSFCLVLSDILFCAVWLIFADGRNSVFSVIYWVCILKSNNNKRATERNWIRMSKNLWNKLQ